jgi:hypothetical protein
MASTCRWPSWGSTFEWNADATVPPDIRTRIEAFLDHVWAAIADLAAALTDATDDDLIAVLGPLAASARPGVRANGGGFRGGHPRPAHRDHQHGSPAGTLTDIHDAVGPFDGLTIERNVAECSVATSIAAAITGWVDRTRVVVLVRSAATVMALVQDKG